MAAPVVSAVSRPAHVESRGPHQGADVVLRPHRARVDHHPQVEDRDALSLEDRLREDRLDDQQQRAGRHRRPAVAQDRDRAVVVPVVDDVAEQVEVASLGHGVEEAPAHYAAAAVEALCVQACARLLRGVRQVEQGALDARIGLQDRREQRAVATADVDHVAGGGEVVAGDDGVGEDVDAGTVAGPAFPQRREVRVLAHGAVEVGAVSAAEGAVTGAHRLGQRHAGVGEPAAAGEERQAGERGAIGLRGEKRLAQRGQREGALVVVGEDAEAGQRPHQAGELTAMRAAAGGELVEVERAGGERLGNPDLDGGANRLRDGPGQDQPDHASTALLGRGRGVRHRGCARH